MLFCPLDPRTEYDCKATSLGGGSTNFLGGRGGLLLSSSLLIYRDKKGRGVTHVDYDPKTLQVHTELVNKYTLDYIILCMVCILFIIMTWGGGGNSVK